MKMKPMFLVVLGALISLSNLSAEDITVSPEDAYSDAEWLSGATDSVGDAATIAVELNESAESLGGLADTVAPFFTEAGSNAAGTVEGLGSGLGMEMATPLNEGRVFGGATAIASEGLASNRNQAKQTIFDTLGKFLDQIKFFEQVQRLTATANKAITMVNQGFETLRIIGDPQALMGALGMDSVGKLAGTVMDTYAKGMQVYDFGASLAGAVNGGGSAASKLMSVASGWTDLADIRTPQQALRYLDASRYQGYDSLKGQYGKLRETMGSFGQSDQVLLAQLQQTTNQLALAKDQSEIMMLQAKAQSIASLLDKNGNDEQRLLLRLLAQDAMNRSQWDVQRLSERDQFAEELDQIGKSYSKGQKNAAEEVMSSWAGNRGTNPHERYQQEIRDIRAGNSELIDSSEPELPSP